MRFSPGLSAALTGYFFKNILKGRKRFPLVLMLEPTHRCNLSCAGCDRIRLYTKGHSWDLTLGECLGAAVESNAPVVTVTGGEPLLYGELRELLSGLIRMKRHIYLCTNGLLAGSFVDAYSPHPRLTLSFHVDGMRETHDRISGRPGSFDAAIEGLKAAKKKGFRVWTNTSIYKWTDIAELLALFILLKEFGVDGILVSPAFGYESVSDDIFLNKEEVAEKFGQMRGLFRGLPMTGTPLYLDFLEGKGGLYCTPWGSPTRNPLGWKSPCYLITDTYYPSYPELMEKTRWEAYGPGSDSRCRDCMVHCGFEPAAMREIFAHPGKMLRCLLWNVFPS
jgi:hopanoid biosynthesis associated radical SAM protein HpnH